VRAEPRYLEGDYRDSSKNLIAEGSMGRRSFRITDWQEKGERNSRLLKAEDRPRQAIEALGIDFETKKKKEREEKKRRS